MPKHRQKTIVAIGMIALVLVTCSFLSWASGVRASGQSGARGVGLGDAKPLVIDPTPDKDVHLQPGWKVFLVGTNTYQNLKPEYHLHYAVKDAENLKARFIQLGVPEEDITILTSNSRGNKTSTKRNIELAFNAFIKNLKEGDTAFVYLSGQGFTHQSRRWGGKPDELSYYVPMDINLNPGPGESLMDTAVSLDDMIGELQKSPAALVWMTIDACRAEPTEDSRKARANTKDVIMPEMFGRSRPERLVVDVPELPENFVLLQSCEPFQYSIESPELEQGLMTYALLEALSPDDNPADHEHFGKLKLIDLLNYVQNRTKELARLSIDEENRPWGQTPVMQTKNLKNVTILTNLRRNGFLVSPQQLIAENEEKFEMCLEKDDFKRAQEVLEELVELYPDGVNSQRYKELKAKELRRRVRRMR